MKNKTFLIIRDRRMDRRDFGPSTRAKFDDLVKQGYGVFVMVDNSRSPDDGFVFEWADLKKVAFRSYDDWVADKRIEGKEVEYG